MIGRGCLGQRGHDGRSAERRGVAGGCAEPVGGGGIHPRKPQCLRVHRLRGETLRTCDVHHSSGDRVTCDRCLAVSCFGRYLER